MSRKKKILIAIVATPFVCALLFFGYRFTRAVIATAIATKNVTKQRESALPEVDQDIKQKTEMLEHAGLVTHQIATSKIDVCYVADKESGWFATGWYQDCYIRTLRGFATNASRATVLQQLSNFRSYFGEPASSELLVTNPCELVDDQYYKETVRYRPANTPVKDEDSNCGVPSQLQGIWTVQGPILLDKELAIKKLEAFDPTLIDNSTNQIWIISDKYYYHEDLGCGIGFFCENPRSKPVQAR